MLLGNVFFCFEFHVSNFVCKFLVCPFLKSFTSAQMTYGLFFNLLANEGSVIQATEIKDRKAIWFLISIWRHFLHKLAKPEVSFFLEISPISGMRRWLLCSCIWGLQSLPEQGCKLLLKHSEHTLKLPQDQMKHDEDQGKKIYSVAFWSEHA